MPPPTPPRKPDCMAVPMGFDARLKALEELQNDQKERIAVLEQENAKLRGFKDSNPVTLARLSVLEQQATEFRVEMLDQQSRARLEKLEQQSLLARIEALEQRNANLLARRKEVVGMLQNLRTLNHEADSAFHARTRDMQQDDLEGMLAIHGTTISTVLNHHQHVLAHLKKASMAMLYPPPIPLFQQPVGPPPTQQPAYPAAYNQGGNCHAHGIQYQCRMCGP